MQILCWLDVTLFKQEDIFTCFYVKNGFVESWQNAADEIMMEILQL